MCVFLLSPLARRYLLALTGLSSSPFRVIDEINQGMDGRNERLVFKSLVEEATATGTGTQVFLLTPKLLPNLFYGEEVCVLNIFNGAYLDIPALTFASA